jgi:rare lipoprotein A
VQQDSVLTDSIAIDSSVVSYTLYKEDVHASYYHDKFNGRKTASGEKFDNNLYTAAHKTLKFGTKLKITNPLNNESVIVTVNDRGPFTKGREIDLSKKAFMDIANCKLPGFLNVTIEIIEE